MIDQFLQRLNSTEFHRSGSIQLSAIEGQIEPSSTMKLHFILKHDEEGYSTIVENWELTAHQTLEEQGIFARSYLPYFKGEILEEHPALWKFTKPELICKLEGHPDNISEFMGDLYFEYEKLTGHWISLLYSYFFNVRKRYQEKKPIYVSIREPLKEPIANICLQHGVTLKVEETNEGSEASYTHHPDAKLFIFGNEQVSPHTFYLWQPYIIAEDFQATRVE